MSDENYFKAREKAREKQLKKLTKEQDKKLAKAWANCEKEINRKISRIIADYAEESKMTTFDAEKFLRKTKIKTSSGRLLTRQELIRVEVKRAIQRLKGIQETTLSSVLMRTYKDGYYSAGWDVCNLVDVNLSFTKVSEHAMEEIFKQEWAGGNYSSRIWHNSNLLAEKLQEQIIEHILMGKPVSKMAREIRNCMGTGLNQAITLARTEVNYIHNQSILNGYKETGVEQFVFTATLDGRTAKKDGELDGKIFDIDKAEVGKNMPPIHPNCRCRIIAYIPYVVRNRIARNEDGTTERVGNMTYSEWIKQAK